MTLADPKVGGWASHDILHSSEMNAVRTELLKAIDGVGGGTYNLTGPLVIDGDAFQVDDELIVSAGADLNVDGDVTLRTGSTLTLDAGSAWQIDSNGEFNANVLINDDLRCNDGGSTHFSIAHAVLFFSLAELGVNDVSVTMLVPQQFAEPQWDVSNVQAGWVIETDGWLALENDALSLYYALPIMAGDTIDAVVLRVVGANALPHGADPANKMRYQIREGTSDGVLSTLIADVVDPTTGATYDAAHTVRLDGTTTGGALPIVALSRPYWLLITSETGANSSPQQSKVRKVEVELLRSHLVSTNVFGA